MKTEDILKKELQNKIKEFDECLLDGIFAFIVLIMILVVAVAFV